MANQKVTVNTIEYGVWFMHKQVDHDGERDDILFHDTIYNALFLRQIKKHAVDEYAPYINGVTCCQLERADRSVASIGYAFCSINDNFNKKVGRAVALGRAIRELEKNEYTE